MFERFKFRQNNNTYSMTKKHVNLSVDENIVKLARMKGINLSNLLEQILLSDNQELSLAKLKTRVQIPIPASDSKLDIYFKNVDLLEICNAQKQFIKKTINEYVLFCDNCINLEHTLNYLDMVKKTKDLCSYNHQYYAIKKYLRFIHSDFINDLPDTKQKNYTPKEVTEKDLEKTKQQFKDDIQIKTILEFGTIGCRAYEIYSLTFEDFDLDNRTISINRNNGKSTKNLMSIRKTYFNEKTRQLLNEYFEYCKLNGITRPFNQLQINKKLKGKDCIMIKDLRHIFIRTAILRGMNQEILNRIVGWKSSNVMNKHYLFLDQEKDNFKKEYDRIFNQVIQ